jgi:hypothetical protein
MTADLLELGLFPFFFEGALSPANDVLDVITAIVLCRLVGWHWAFLPTFAAELIPAASLFPTWTAAVLFVTRGGATEAVTPREAARPAKEVAEPNPVIEIEAREVQLVEGDGRPRK